MACIPLSKTRLACPRRAPQKTITPERHGEQKWRIWWTQKGVLNVKKCFFVKLQNMATQVTCGSITSFVILRLGGLDHQFDNLTKHKKWYRNKLLPDDQRPSSWEWWLRCWWSWCLHRSWPSAYPALGAKASLQAVGHRLGSQVVRLVFI